MAEGHETPSERPGLRPPAPHLDGPLGSSGAAPSEQSAPPAETPAKPAATEPAAPASSSQAGATPAGETSPASDAPSEPPISATPSGETSPATTAPRRPRRSASSPSRTRTASGEAKTGAGKSSRRKTGTTAAGRAKTDAGKPSRAKTDTTVAGEAKTDAGKPDPTKTDTTAAGKAETDAGKPSRRKTGPVAAGEAKTDAGKPNPTKTDTTAAGKAETDAGKPSRPKTGTTAADKGQADAGKPTGEKIGTSVEAGPKLGSTSPSGTKPSGTAAPDSAPPNEPKAAAALPSKVKPGATAAKRIRPGAIPPGKGRPGASMLDETGIAPSSLAEAKEAARAAAHPLPATRKPTGSPAEPARDDKPAKDDKPKTGEAKDLPAGDKPKDGTAGDSKAGDTKTGDTKAVDGKPKDGHIDLDAPVVVTVGSASGRRVTRVLRRANPIRVARTAGRSTHAWAKRPAGRLILPAIIAVLLLGAAGTAGAYLVPQALEANPSPSATPGFPLEAAAPGPSGAAALPSVPPVQQSAPVVPPAAGGGRPADALASWAQGVGTRVGIPVVAVQAYGYAELVAARTAPNCRLSWTTLAAIAKVESAHGSANGAVLGADGSVQPPIYGLPLDGKGGRQLIRDTDQGTLDSDPTFDRAMGPMQFIPTTWQEMKIDADNSGVADPNDIDDAALAAALYLCRGGRDMSRADAWWDAILSYNAVQPYAQKVFDAANEYGRRSRV